MFTLQFETDSAQFDDDGLTQVAKLLRQIARRVASGPAAGDFLLGKFNTVHDENGNHIGQWKVTEDRG